MIYITDKISDSFTSSTGLYYRIKVYNQATDTKDVIFYGYTVPTNNTISVTINNVVKHLFKCDIVGQATTPSAVVKIDNVMLLPLVIVEYSDDNTFGTLVRATEFENIVNADTFFGVKYAYFDNDNDIKSYDDWINMGSELIGVNKFAQYETDNINYIFPKRFIKVDSYQQTYIKDITLKAYFLDSSNNSIGSHTFYTLSTPLTYSMLNVSINLYYLQANAGSEGINLSQWRGGVRFRLEGTFYNNGTETATVFSSFDRPFTFGSLGADWCSPNLLLLCVGRYGITKQYRLYGADRKKRDYAKETIIQQSDTTKNYKTTITEQITANTGFIDASKQEDLERIYSTLKLKLYIPDTNVMLDVDNLATTWQEYKYKQDRRLCNTELTLTCNKKISLQYD